MITGFEVDAVLKLGEILGFLGGAGFVVFKLGRVTTKFEEAVKSQGAAITEIKADIKTLNGLVTDMALEKQRIGMLEKRVDELAHGRGFIDVEVKRTRPRAV